MSMTALTQVKLLKILESATQAALPDLPFVAQSIELKHYSAGAVVFDQGTEHPFLYGLTSGLIKLVYVDVNGKEWIKSFIPEGGFFASLSALQAKGIASFSAIAIEPTTLERLDYRVLLALAQKHLGWAEVALNLTLTYAAKKEERERELLTLTPEERYVAFCERSDQLIKRIPQKDLARHLGVTPVGLNRIIQRLKK
jgi:CRP-like cAMP-binding protein